MTAPETEPTRDELLAMAYVDGELDEAARVEFDARLRAEPALLREVSELRQFGVIARQVAPPEPMDYEWERLDKEVLYGGSQRLGLFLIALAAAGFALLGVITIWASSLEPVPKFLVGALLLGLSLVFLATLRGRLRTLPHDPYTEVRR